MTEYYVEGIDLTSKSTAVRSISEKYSISNGHKFLSGGRTNEGGQASKSHKRNEGYIFSLYLINEGGLI